jgi:hypothetical protein
MNMKKMRAVMALGALLAPLLACAAERAVDVVVEAGKAVGGTQTVRVVRDDDVRLTVRSDVDGEVHLHGYDLHLHLKSGQPGTLRFTAKRTGRFSAELHGSNAELVVFEIYPR